MTSLQFKKIKTCVYFLRWDLGSFQNIWWLSIPETPYCGCNIRSRRNVCFPYLGFKLIIIQIQTYFSLWNRDKRLVAKTFLPHFSSFLFYVFYFIQSIKFLFLVQCRTYNVHIVFGPMEVRFRDSYWVLGKPIR
jgi:hypothetical protein